MLQQCHECVFFWTVMKSFAVCLVCELRVRVTRYVNLTDDLFSIDLVSAGGKRLSVEVKPIVIWLAIRMYAETIAEQEQTAGPGIHPFYELWSIRLSFSKRLPIEPISAH